ncbi:MAG: PAN domain-containing protein [Methanotrichaceae archaeon]|nr:PAN domain-containing protein [Methanotrichaceae archaeon]
MKINLTLTFFLGIIILIATAQGVRPTIQGDPAASAWYTDTSIPNGLDDYGGVFDPRANPDWRGLNVYDQINVFARSNDDSLLWYRLTPKNRVSFGTLSIVLPGTLQIYSSPAVVQRGPNTIDVFVVGKVGSQNNQDLYNLKWDGSRWSMNPMGFRNPAITGISAAWWGDPNRIDLFLLWNNRELDQYIWNGRDLQTQNTIGLPSHLWPNLAPAAGSWGPNHLDVVVMGEGDSYYRNSYDLGRWGGWQNIGGFLTSAPSITPTPPFPGGGGERKINIFGRDRGMDLVAKGIKADGTPTMWVGFGGDLNSAPAAINYVGDHFTVFARKMDNTLWWLDWDVGAEDFRWQPVPDLPEVQAIEREVGTSGPGPISEEQGSTILMVNDTYIPGSDYRDFDLATADPKLCAQACTDDPTCVACTYVNPGYQGPNARCWLKNNVATQVQDECCQTGVKEIRAVIPQVAQDQTVSMTNDTDLPGSDYGDLGENVPATIEVPGTTLVSPTQAVSMTNDTDRPGSDYTNLELAKADPNLCAQMCTAEPQCRAWTYVKPGYQGSNAQCWLKNNVPDQVPAECCVSGVKGEANVLTRVIIP